MDDEEVAGEGEVGDDLQLVVDLRPRAGHPLGALRGGARAVALASLDLDELDQPARLVVPRGHREGRQGGGDEAQVQRLVPADPRRRRDRARVAGQQPAHLLAAAQVLQVPGQVGVRLGERHRGAQGGVGVGEVLPVRGRVVGVRGRDQRQGHRVQAVGLPHQACPLGEGVVQLVGLSPGAGGELDGDVPRPVQLQQAADALRGRVRGAVEVPGRQVRGDGAGHSALAAAGEDQPVPLAGDPGQLGEAVPGHALLAGVEVGAGDHGGELRVALRVPHEHQQVLAVRVRHAGARGGAHGGGGGGVGPGLEAQGELGADHGGHALLRGGLREAHHPVEAVVVHEGDRLQAQRGRLAGHVLRGGGAVEEAEVGVGVQLGVGDDRLGPVQHRPLPRVLDRDRRGHGRARAVREDRLEVLPCGRSQEPARHQRLRPSPRENAPS